MSLIDEIGPHLPYVRRYARALTGAQSSGDAYVRAALEALAAGDRDIDPTLGPKLALYKLFHAIWSSAAPHYDPAHFGEAAGEDDTPQGRLMRVTPTNRQALLLTAVEGFSADEAADIIGVDRDALTALVVEAQREIEAEMATDVLVIEDEPVIAVDLENVVRSLGHDVTSVARTRSEAVEAARGRRPGLVLADIQLADGSSGVDAVKDILRDFDVPVIFITAFPERLLSDERPEPAYLITKPFLPETVKAAIGQALFFHPRNAANA